MKLVEWVDESRIYASKAHELNSHVICSMPLFLAFCAEGPWGSQASEQALTRTGH